MADPGEGALSRGERPLRVLFICTQNRQNRLRSPTAEAVFRTHSGWEVASAGKARDAGTPLPRDLLDWADVAVCMEKGHRDWIRSKLKGVLPDEYELMDPELVTLLERLVPARLARKAPR